ncbi:ATP-binding protein [Chitinophaga ginsengisoli]|uniref:Magnesium chelatase subunit D n=1 Tax=Chitinophaga ginsengisoli TaxID=363837 RepID=A0A2P8FXD9_9BACT|nr:AAA family ATPase [Chitinophaga ginsengisoli]PSL26388.1 magnesium chelatase subunit D [Chitinophaga ginsengisoli]
MRSFPFTAIYAQEDFKLALILCMIDPGLGGVLALGDKGTGKTTTVRGLSHLMQRCITGFPFVNLPIGATEDRVLGTIRLDILINEKRTEVQQGLLAAANQGILYIDEVNLLNDYLMDVLLDAAASGAYHLERDTVSQWFESKFCLVGTMNPEEGELRPQLLDRFGLSVTVKTPMDRIDRMEIISRRLQFDTDTPAFIEKYDRQEQQLVQQIMYAREQLKQVSYSDMILANIADTCIQYQVEGLRADILLLKAARAHAAFFGKKEVTTDDIHKVMPFVLSHRSKHYSSTQNSQQQRENQSPREEKEGDSIRISMS